MRKIQDCYHGKISIHPKNWKEKGASTKKDWYIAYRYYDPSFTDKYKYGYQVQIRGMNSEKNLADRRAITLQLLDNEKELLDKKGYNPITGKFFEPIEFGFELNPETPFIRALWVAQSKVQCSTGNMIDLKCCIRGVEQAARDLQIDKLPIGRVSRKYIKAVLEQCSKNITRWSGNRHNKYRTHLIGLFRELIEMEAVDINPVKDIAKQPIIKKQRLLLTLEERKLIDTTLRESQYEFWRAIQIFFHSGSRITELFNVRGQDVDLGNQRCKYLVLKGRSRREVWRPVKDSVLYLWQEIIQQCQPNDYLFSENLKPGISHIRPDQFTKRWLRCVKKGLSIKADLYSLKHANTDETAELLSIQDAAKQNAHLSTVVTLNSYAFGEKGRQLERLKKVGNKFAG